MRRNKIKRYKVKPNYDVDAVEWWRSARNATLIPPALVGLLFGAVEVVEIDEIDLEWCMRLPMWDGLDGPALKVKRLR